MKRISPWIWIPGLFCAQGIPTAIFTFVSLLMFIRFDVGYSLATVFMSMLFVPSVLKSFFRSRIRLIRNYKLSINIVEGLIFVTLCAMALSTHSHNASPESLFIWMFLISMLCSWHELLARMYYEKTLNLRDRIYFYKVKTFATLSTLILTYGVIIILVGFLEIFFRNIPHAWSMACYIMAGVFLLFFLVNIFLPPRRPLHLGISASESSLYGSVKTDARILDRMMRRKYSMRTFFFMFILMLPQALMFNTRVFFLLASSDDGGLGCSIQDIGFAQGTVGVIGFSAGILLGRMLLRRYGAFRTFWPMVIAVGLSPLLYLIMTLHNPETLGQLSVMTFLAQFLFGFGLNISIMFVAYISDDRYQSTINYLYIPFVAASMIVPMMLSGWLVTVMGFTRFFLLNALCAPLAWIIFAVTGARHCYVRKIR